MGLYQSGYRPFRLPKQYDATPITIGGENQAADIMRRKGALSEWGDPVDAVAFFDDDTGHLVALTCDYANGRRAEYRQTKSGSRTSFTRPARP